MHRREVLKSAGLASLGVLLTGKRAFGEATDPNPAPTPIFEPGFDTEITISRNHGHVLEIATLYELVKLLREVSVNGAKTFDISGTSHQHLVEMDEDVLLEALVSGQVEIESTQDFGHTHTVTLKVVDRQKPPITPPAPKEATL